MLNSQLGGSKTPVKYTIKIEVISDMDGYVVEIVDKFNSKNYTLYNIYSDKDKAIKEGNIFVNDLFEEENSMLIN